MAKFVSDQKSYQKKLILHFPAANNLAENCAKHLIVVKNIFSSFSCVVIVCKGPFKKYVTLFGYFSESPPYVTLGFV